MLRFTPATKFELSDRSSKMPSSSRSNTGLVSVPPLTMLISIKNPVPPNAHGESSGIKVVNSMRSPSAIGLVTDFSPASGRSILKPMRSPAAGFVPQPVIKTLVIVRTARLPAVSAVMV